MSLKYSYNIENINLAIDKAKTKKGGVYSFRGFLYRVSNFRITHIAHRGMILERFGNFDVELCKYNYEREARSILESFTSGK